MADFYTILTNVGLAKINAAVANNENLILKEFAVGDGNGIYVTPTPNQTKLVNERYRSLISSVLIHAENSNWLEIICIIPTEIGGFTIREVGLFDEDGDLIAVTKHPATYKPLVSEGTAKELFIKNIIAVENASNVSISFDNSSVYITKEYVDNGDSKKVDKVAGKGLSDTNFTASEKDKLEDIDPGANNYSLPNATGSVKGGVIVGTNIDVSNGSISIKNASTTQKGVVQLNDTTTSESTTAAPTARALKEVADSTETLSDNLDMVTGTLADFANEVTLTPMEKLSVWRTWLIVVDEKAMIIAQADAFGIDTTAYVSAYNSYDSYLYGTTGVLNDMKRNNTITPAIFQSKLTNYNHEKVNLLKAITDTVKSMTDALNSKITNTETALNNKITTTQASVKRIDEVELPKYYKNGSGGGTLSNATSLSAGGIVSSYEGFYIGAGTMVYITDKNGFNGDNPITYMPVKAAGFLGSALSTTATHIYLRAATDGEARITALNTTDNYRPIKASAFTNASSYELKDEIELMTRPAIDIVDAIRVYEYRYSSDVVNGVDDKKIGLIAEYSPQINNLEGNGIDLYKMLSVNWKATQELYQLIKGHDMTIGLQQTQIDDQQIQINILQQELQDIKALLQNNN